VCAELARLAREEPDRPLLSTRTPEGGWTTTTAARLHASVGACAAGAAEAGLRPGDFALVRLPDGEPFFRAVLAAWWLGCTPLIASPRATPPEVDRLFSSLGVTAGETPELAAPLVASPTAAAPPPIAPEPARGWYMPSGGTTGLPSFTPVLQSPTVQFEGARALMAATGWSRDAVQLVGSRLFHAGTFVTAMAGLLAGAHLVVPDRFDAARAADAVRRFPPTWAHLVPQAMEILDADEELAAAFGRRLRGLLHGSNRCRDDHKRRWLDRLGPDRVFELYSSTQMVSSALCTGREWLERPGTVGRPLFCEVQVLDEHLRPVPPGTPGEIFARGTPPVRVGADALTHLRSAPGGFLSVGDVGYLDEDGYLYLTDRIDGVFTVAGVKVSAAQVEEVLLAHPAVREAVVTRREDAGRENTVHATVVLRPGAQGVAPEDIRAFCAERLNPQRTPAAVVIATELRLSRAGKVERFRY
jgi:bile acid-coenzyme A ligase